MKKFFDELIQQLKKDPEKFSELMFAAEDAFKHFGYRERFTAGVENILVVRADAIGDMILTSGFLRELRAIFPHARITLICAPLTYPIVELCPYVNEVLTFDRKSLSNNFPQRFETIATFCRKNLWQKNFSLAFSPQWGSNNFFALLICWLSGARERIGYGVSPYAGWGIKPKQNEANIDNFLLTKNIVTPQSVISEAEKNFYLLEAVGLKVAEMHMELFFGAADVLRAQELLKNISPAAKKVVLGIGAGLESRRYPAEKFLVALRELARKNLTFIIVGGNNELDDAAYLEENLPREKVLNLVGKTTLRETEAVISQADYYVGNDSGVMHMAAAAQVPCLVLYREAQDKENYLPGIFSGYRRFSPWQTNCVILRPDHQLDDCAKRPPIHGWCHHDEPHCITQITPQEIVAGFEVLES